MKMNSNVSLDDKKRKERFDRAVALFDKIRKSVRRRESPIKKMIRLMRNAQNVRDFYARHGHKEFTHGVYPKREKERTGKAVFREVMMYHSDDILCLTGGDLETLVAEFGVEPSLPVRQKQEAVYLAALDRITHGKSKRRKTTKTKVKCL